MTGNILLLEDDYSLCRGISFKLEKEGYRVWAAGSVRKGLELFTENPVDFVICDITLEDGSGIDFCRKIRETSLVRFLFLTALDTEIDIVMGYEVGADDYMTKPFSLSVLLSKVNAAFARRYASGDIEGKDGRTAIRSGPLTFNSSEMKLTIGGNIVALTKNELRLLSLFLERPGQVLTKAQFLEALWDYNSQFVDENTVAVNIRRLREKIETNPARPELIKNVRGIGYLWNHPTEYMKIKEDQK